MAQPIDFWDKMAGRYDSEEKKDEKTIHSTTERIKKHLKTTDQVLDFGCATGSTAIAIANQVKEVHGLDISPEMIRLAKEKVAQNNRENTQFRTGSLFDEHYEEGSYDVIVAFYVLHLLEDTEETLKRLSTLLKPNGLLLSVTPCMGERLLLSGLLTALSKLNLQPKMRALKIIELKELVEKANLSVIEEDRIGRGASEYYMVARKR